MEDLSTKILPPKLDLTGRVSFLNLNSFTDFVEKYHDREDLDIFKDEFVSLRQRNEELANSNPSLLRIEDDDIEEDYIVTDDFTASIVNEDRELMIDGKVVKYTEYGTLVYHDDFTERVKQLLEVMTPKEVEAIYATHDFEEDSFYEIEPGIYLFGTVEEEVVDMEVKSVDYSNAVWAPGHHPDNFNFYYCNRTTNKRTEAEGWGHWTGGVRKTAYIYFANNRRMKAKVWSTNYGTHSTGGFFTKNQRRRLRVWWESDADIVSISVKANTYHPHPTTSIYYPLYYIPGPLNHHNGTEEDFNKNKVKIGWPPYTLTFVYSPGSPITKQCKPQYDLSPGWNPVEQNKPYACKPTWKFSKRVKIKESESCHYVKRGNQDGEIRILINKNID